MMIKFIKLQDQNSEVTELIISDKTEYNKGLITYFDGSKTIRKYRIFGKKTHPYAYSRFFNEYFNTPEDLLKRYQWYFNKVSLTIFDGKLYEKEKIWIKVKNGEDKIFSFNSAIEIYQFLKNLLDTIDVKGLYTNIGTDLVSVREFVAKYGDRDSLNIE